MFTPGRDFEQDDQFSISDDECDERDDPDFQRERQFDEDKSANEYLLDSKVILDTFFNQLDDIFQDYSRSKK